MTALGPMADYDDLIDAGIYGTHDDEPPPHSEPPPGDEDYAAATHDRSDQSDQSPGPGHLSSLSSHVASWEEDAPWPTPAAEMFHGPLGEFALEAAQHTEADAAGVLAHGLTYFGAAVGRGPHMLAGNARHPAALFTLVVGKTSAGGKGTAGAATVPVFAALDEQFMRTRVLGGFGSGEAVVAKLCPPEEGTHDHRLLVNESEFSSVFARTGRDGSTMSQTLRDGWDQTPLANRTRSGGELVARDYHLGIIGHIVAEELRMSTGDAFGGFGNRFTYWCVRRGQLRPDGGNVPVALFAECARRLAPALRTARSRGEMHRTAEARTAWHALYYHLAEDNPPGLLGKVLARSAPQCLRLSLAFALADGADAIDVEHVTAAAAVWDYCRASAAHLFGDSTGHPDADRLLLCLREAGEVGLDLTAQRDMFSRHPGRAERARAVLERHGLAITEPVPTSGRPRHVTRATNGTEATKALSSLRSLTSPVATSERHR